MHGAAMRPPSRIMTLAGNLAELVYLGTALAALLNLCGKMEIASAAVHFWHCGDGT